LPTLQAASTGWQGLWLPLADIPFLKTGATYSANPFRSVFSCIVVDSTGGIRFTITQTYAPAASPK
jgi:hypothetical protein